MAEKKSGLLAVLEVLRENSDENHLLSRQEIIERIQENRGLTMDRRTLYSCINLLEEYGYDISDFERNGKGYALVNRTFSQVEILWLCNAIHACNFIPAKSSNELIKKLLNTQSSYVRKEYSNTVYLPNKRKTENHELFRNIERITEAIHSRCRISFVYMTYNTTGKLVEKRKERYVREPRYIVYSEGKGYLIVTDPKHPGFSHYRLDRMKHVLVMEEDKVAPLLKEQDPYDYAKNKLFMFAGRNVSATFRCSMYVLNQMVDLFGKDMHITKENDGSFLMTISAPEQGLIWLAEEYLDSIEIVSPGDLREKMRVNLRKALERYENE